MPYKPAPRSTTPKSSGSKPGSKSPNHRGYRPESEAPKKKRWNADERAARSASPERDAKRPDWTPRDKPARGSYNDRPARDDRPARSFDRDERAPRRSDDRPARSFDRDDRAPRRDGGDRPARSYDDRAPRRDAGDRPARSFDRDDRAPRRDGGDRPARSYDDRAPRRDVGDRPARSFDRGGDRPARSFDRDDRAPRRDAGDRPARSFDRGGDRPARSFDRDDRPRRSFDDRAPRRDFGDRGPKSWDDRPARRESSFYPDRDKAAEALDDAVLEKLTATSVDAVDVENTTFGDLGLGQNIVRVLAELGAAAPFPIQAATIPDVLAGRDVLGRGRTGSGKTIAFGAPLVERLLASTRGGVKRQMGRKPRALILAPTRELALQIDGTVQPIARSVGLFTTQIYGGVPQQRQVGALQKGVDIIVGTPGRIEDLVRQGRLDLSQIEITVVDEADHMCELGFLEPVQRILRETKDGGQKLLFSATLDSRVANLVQEFLVEPAVYEVAGEDQASSTIEHRVFLIDQYDKRQIIAELAAGDGKTIVFTRTRAFAEELAETLEDHGIRATSLHGDLNQAKRTRNLERLTSGRVSVLVATDVAARGIHVDDITLVIQADAPEEYKTYLHRAGRTGRAGKAGTVVTLVNRNRRRKVDELLGRAEISATYDQVRPGDEIISTLAAL